MEGFIHHKAFDTQNTLLPSEGQGGTSSNAATLARLDNPQTMSYSGGDADKRYKRLNNGIYRENDHTNIDRWLADA